MEHMQRLWLASRERLPFRTPGSVPHLLMLQMLRPNSSNLPCLYSTFHHEYPLVLSRFCIIPFNKMLVFTINALCEQNLQLGYHFGQNTELRSLMCWCTILWGDDGIIEFMCSIKQFIASHHFLCTYIFQDNFRDRCSLIYQSLITWCFVYNEKISCEKFFPPPPHSSTCYMYIILFIYIVIIYHRLRNTILIFIILMLCIFVVCMFLQM